jgi:cell division protein FtsX
MKMTKKFIFTVICSLIVMSFCAGIAIAAPSVKMDKTRDKVTKVTIQESVTAEIIAEIKKEVEDASGILFVLEKIESNDDLARLCEAFPDMDGLSINQPMELTSIAPVAKLVKLQVPKDTFTEEQLAKFATPDIKVTQR